MKNSVVLLFAYGQLKELGSFIICIEINPEALLSADGLLKNSVNLLFAYELIKNSVAFLLGYGLLK